MDTIDQEIAAYESMLGMLEAKHLGQWVLLRDRLLVGAYATFDDAATDAIAKFGRGPYLIREVGAAPVAMPASVAWQSFVHAKH